MPIRVCCSCYVGHSEIQIISLWNQQSTLHPSCISNVIFIFFKKRGSSIFPRMKGHYGKLTSQVRLFPIHSICGTRGRNKRCIFNADSFIRCTRCFFQYRSLVIQCVFHIGSLSLSRLKWVPEERQAFIISLLSAVRNTKKLSSSWIIMFPLYPYLFTAQNRNKCIKTDLLALNS